MAAVPIGTIKSSTYRSGEKDLTWAASAGVSCTETQPPDGSGSTVLQICRLRAEVLLPGLAALYLVISAGCQRVPSQEDAIAAVVKLGGYVKCADETPAKPVILVNLFQTPTTDHDLDKLTPLTQLECLNLAWTRVSDTGLARVGMFKSRRWLFLQGTRVRGRGLKSLSGLDDLEFLDLSRTQVADSALRQLPAVPQLRTVLLIQCGLTDSATPSLSRLRGLQRLELQKNHITSAGLRSLSALQNLTELSLDDNAITDTGLDALIPLGRLRRLILGENRLTDKAVPTLSRLKNLQVLDVQDTLISAPGAAAIRKALPTCKVLCEVDRGDKSAPSAGQLGGKGGS